MTFGEIPLAPYATPGTLDLSDSLRPLVPAHDAILMATMEWSPAEMIFLTRI